MNDRMTKRLSLDDHAKDPLLADFIEGVHGLVDGTRTIPELMQGVSDRLDHLLRTWSMPDPRYRRMQRNAIYGSYVLYTAPDAGFVVVLDTFGANQATHIHNHRTWAVVGLLAGSEENEMFAMPPALDCAPIFVDSHRSKPGDIAVFPESGMHRLSTRQGVESQSLHVYGADVGVIKRLRWDPELERYSEFRQGWSNDAEGLPDYFDSPMLGYTELRRSALGYLTAS